MSDIGMPDQSALLTSDAARPALFGRSAVSNTIFMVTSAVVALITTPILIAHLGAERYGIWIFVGSTLAYLEVLEFGFGGAVVHLISRFSAAGDEDSLMQTLSTSFFVLSGLGIVALVAIALGALFLPDVLRLHGSLSTTMRYLLLLLGVDAAVSIPMDTFGCGLIALQRFDLLNASLVGVTSAGAVAMVVVLLSGGGLLLLGVVTVVIGLSGQVARYVLFRRVHPGTSISPRLVDRAALRRLTRPAGWFALASAVNSARAYAKPLVLGIVRNVTSVGIYAVGDKLALLGSKAGTAVAEPYFPHAASLAGRDETSGLRDASQSGGPVAAGVIIPFCLVIGVFARPALHAWVGPYFERATPVVIVLAISTAMGSFDVIPFKLISGAGGQKLLSLMGIAEAAVDIAFTAVLGYYFGLLGVALALLITVVVVEVGITLPLVCRRLNLRIREVFLPVLRAHALAIVVAGSVGWVLSVGPVIRFVHHHSRAANLGVVAIAGTVVLCLYAGVFVLTGVDRAVRRTMLVRVPFVGRKVGTRDDIDRTAATDRDEPRTSPP